MKKPGDVENKNQFQPRDNELLKGLKATKVEDPILEHRLLVQNFVQKMAPEYSVVRGFLPLAIGFAYFLMSKMSSGTYEPIFTHNLPVLTSFKPKINLDTWTSIIKSNFDGQPPKKNLLLGQPELIGKIKNRASLDREGITGLSCSGFDLRLQNKFLKNGQPFVLDELPAYLEGVALVPENDTPTYEPLQSEPLESTLFASEPLKNDAPHTELLESTPSVEFVNSLPQTLKPKQVKTFHTKKSPGSFFLSNSSSDETELTLLGKHFQGKAVSSSSSSPDEKSPLITSLFSTNRAKLARLVEKLDKQLFVDFIEKNNFQTGLDADKLLSIEERRTDVLSGHLRDILDVDLLDEIVEFFEEQPTYPRLMSGYIYPDSSRRHLEWFYKQKSQRFFTKRSPVRFVLPDLKEDLLGLDVSTIKYNFLVNKLPRISVETHEVAVPSRDGQNILYEGPGLVLDSERALDWKVSGELRSWFHTYLSPLNPLYQKQENFVGVDLATSGVDFEPLEFMQQNREVFMKFLKNAKKADRPTHRALAHTLPTNPDIGPYKVQLYIPAEPEKWSDKGLFRAPKNSEIEKYPMLEFDIEDEETIPGVDLLPRYSLKDQASLDFLPFVTVPVAGSSNFSPTKESKNGYSPVFNLGITSNSDYTFTPNVFEYISPQRVDRYIKRASLYSKRSLFSKLFIRLKLEFARFVGLPPTWVKTSQRTQVSLWEPLTSESWLVFTQITFAIFFFHTLLGIYKTYGEELLDHLLDLTRHLPYVPQRILDHILFLRGGPTDTGYRLIWNSPKRFAQLPGVWDPLAQLGEVFPFLRAKTPAGLFRRILPRGILLFGSPGTGKSTFVQAVAGETGVPIILMSGSSLIGPNRTAGRRLRALFKEAHEIAPCIIFIDELDTIGWKRTHVLIKDPTKRNVIGPWEKSILIPELKETVHFEDYYESPMDKLYKQREEQKRIEELRYQGKYYFPEEVDDTHQLSLLVELLIQMDGLVENSARTQVVVFGATNYPENLDPALLRPGRFDRFIDVKRPRERERIKILQLYSQSMGYEANIPWKYLAARTEGFSGADLYTLVNGSAMNIITSQKSAIHTVRTLESGIELISAKRSMKHLLRKKIQKKKGRPDLLRNGLKLEIIRFAYYHAGKTLVSYLLETHPNPAAATLWPPRLESSRVLELKEKLRRAIEGCPITQIYERIIGCYGGKAAEYLFLMRFASVQSRKISSLGYKDMVFAHHLTFYLVENLTIYTDKFRKLRGFEMLNERNVRSSEIVEARVKFLKDLSTDEYNIRKRSKDFVIEQSGIRKTPAQREKEKRQIPLSTRKMRTEEWRLWTADIPNEMLFDTSALKWEEYGELTPPKNPRLAWKYVILWWPDIHYHTLSGIRNLPGMGRWVRRPSRLYKKYLKELAARESADTRDEKLQSHSSETRETLPSQATETAQKPLKFPKAIKKKRTFMRWKDYPNLIRDYPIHSLTLQSFNKALVILNQNRELLDRIVVDVVYNEIVRQPELEKYIQEFYPNYSPNQKPDVDENFTFEKPKGVKILKPAWGLKTRRPLPRWIDFSAFDSSEQN